MPGQPDRNQLLQTSFFDRLIDDEPRVSREAAQTGPQTLRALRQAVRRDLNNLLNTRRRAAPVPSDLRELDVSLVNYGLPDFCSAHSRAAQDPETFLAQVADSIRKFEPRLKNVRVELVRQAGQQDRALHFRIDAVLFVDPISDPITFDSVFEPTRGAFEIQRGTS